MSLATNLLTDAGYELISINGESVFPCTLVKDGAPLGFIMRDGTVSLLPEHEQARGELEAINAFSRSHSGLEQRPEGLFMTQYQQYALVANYDRTSRAAIYSILERSENGFREIQRLSNREDAVQSFVKQSGLLLSDQDRKPEKENRPRLVTEPKQYIIVDPEGKEVGYVGRNGMAKMYADKPKPERPSFLDTLRKKLAEIGMSIRVHYRRKGQHYAVRDDASQRDVAYLTPEQPRSIQYTPYATPQQQARIDAIVEEILAEQARAAAEPMPSQQLTQAQLPQQQAVQPFPVPQQSSQQAPQRQTAQAEKVQFSPAPKEPVQQASQQQQRGTAILNDFDMKLREIAMMEGFNPELASRQKEILTQLYGTLDRSALEKSIAHGDFAKDMNRNLEAAALKSQWNALIPSAQTGSTPRREENQIAQR